jgi:hypothetical protein
LVWENKAILFLTGVVLSMRQVRAEKLPRAEAGARQRKTLARGRREGKEKKRRRRTRWWLKNKSWRTSRRRRAIPLR